MERRHILTPDQRLRVFVSSTLRELEKERADVPPETIVWPGFSLKDYAPPALTQEPALALS